MDDCGASFSAWSNVSIHCEDESRAEKGALTPHYRCVALPDGLQEE